MLVACLVALAGCGGGAADERAVSELAEDHLAAMVERDWKAVCATLTSEERQPVEGRTCEQQYADLAADFGALLESFESLEVGEVRVAGDEATIELTLEEGRRPSDPPLLYRAVKEDGRWAMAGQVE